MLNDDRKENWNRLLDKVATIILIYPFFIMFLLLLFPNALTFLHVFGPTGFLLIPVAPAILLLPALFWSASRSHDSPFWKQFHGDAMFRLKVMLGGISLMVVLTFIALLLKGGSQ